jgi:hypothetical protein
MFRDAFEKKFWAFPATLVAHPLASVPASMRPLPPAAAEVLSSITRHTPLKIADAHRDDDGDWFRLESEHLLDHEVFHRLSNNWAAIGGPNRLQFSLIHCVTGLDSGIWLHHRKVGTVPQYFHGCQRIISWS